MTGYDQVLMIGSGIGVMLMIAALWNVRQLKKHEREIERINRSKPHPAE